MMKILVVCSDFPYPADHGGRVDTWGRIKALAELGWRIDLAVCAKQAPSAADREAASVYVNRILFRERTGRLADLLHRLPMQVQSRVGLRQMELDGGYDYVLLEGDYVYPILEHPAISPASAILRVHNDEAAYFKALARSAGNPAHKLYYYMESLKFAGLQERMRRKVDKYLFISSKEYDRFRERDPGAISRFLPPPITREVFKPGTLHRGHVVFIGSLFMPNNREAIHWYLTHVHPKLRGEPGYRFIVAGNTRGRGLDWLKGADLRDVEVHDTPESLDGIYGQGYLFVNPMRNGAGVKLKTIEAIQNGLPVVSTSVGCEGTGLVDGEHILVADSPEAFCDRIRLLLRDPGMAGKLLESSQLFIRTCYNHKEVLKGFFQSLGPQISQEWSASDAQQKNQRHVCDARG
ncbi:glycosyltransferase family 4 protein [Paenibacillus sp. J5C_2022]|uniref:glycosyltransferase family 4 protein n=1 Tax=Paenibacillus sp. J5C2022 TaxID=2977129 RepID=UPI0021D08AFE|nr:glycosyltransferase family 4 protein [Paenibacillus sp. J5C2022]MCU6707969.1 glycosyltransferase family 4 protein [Paenibacillus sp. J5C2022]